MNKISFFTLFFIISCNSTKIDNQRRTLIITQTGISNYCHINSAGYRQCNYRNIEKCQRARQFLRGICKKNMN